MQCRLPWDKKDLLPASHPTLGPLQALLSPGDPGHWTQGARLRCLCLLTPSWCGNEALACVVSSGIWVGLET